MQGLISILERLRGADVPGELWIDGSFVTEKVDPNDVDFVFRFQAEAYDSFSPEQKQAIEYLNEEDLHRDLLCDAYLLAQYREGHPHFWFGEYMYAYWMKQWGFSRDGAFKGIAVIDLLNGGPT